MGLLIWTFLITTVGEAAGLIWWMVELERSRTASAYAGLATGEAVELAMFIYYLTKAPDQGGGRRFPVVVVAMVLIALFEVGVWTIWRGSLARFGPFAGAAVLFVLMHLKHDADVANISDTALGRTWFTAKGFAATGLETLGAMLAIHFVLDNQVMLAAVLLCACITVEHIFGGLIVGEGLAGRDFLTPNPRRFVGKQNAMTVVSNVKPESIEALTSLLRTIGSNVASTPDFPVAKLTRLHFCCWCLANRKTRPVLIFEANFDGPEGEFLDELLEVLGPGLASVYRLCEEMPDHPAKQDVRRHLTSQRIFTNTFYVGVHGEAAGEIHREEGLRLEIEKFVDAKQSDGIFRDDTSARDIRQAIQDQIEQDSRFAWTKVPLTIPWYVRHGKTWATLIRYLAIGLAALLVAALLFNGGALVLRHDVPVWVIVPSLVAIAIIVVIGLYILRLRWHEQHDPQPDWSHLGRPAQDVFLRENQQAINHLANVAPLKAGWTRWVTIRGVLFIVHWAARLVHNRGVLAGTSTIHFARWAVINRGKDLLFLSNYDGSWERYLTDFVDRSSPGLTAIWGNTEEFPRTRWLVFGGAADDENFKAAARRRQVESLLWYSAYPQLTMSNIQNNRAIRADLFTELDDAATVDWLRRL